MTEEGERRKLTEKCDVVMEDTEKGMLVVIDNQDTDEYTLKFDFGNSENCTMNVCEGAVRLEEKKCELVVPGGTKRKMADMNIDDMDVGSMSVKYKTNISVKRSGSDLSETISTDVPEVAPTPTKPETTTTTATTTTTTTIPTPSPPLEKTTSSSLSGTVQEEKEPAKVKAASDEERKIAEDVFFAIKKNFEGYIIYVDNKSRNPVVVTADFATCTGGTPKAGAGVQTKGATTYVLRVEENRKLPICKVIATDKSNIADCKVLYKADVTADLSANALGDMHAKLKAKAEAREKAEQAAKDAAPSAPPGGKPGGASSHGPSGALVAGAALKETLSKLDGERKITDTLTFIVKASVDGYVTYLDSKDVDPFVVTVDFAGTENLNINTMVGCSHVGDSKYTMTIDPNRKFPFVKMPLADKTNDDWSLKYSFTFKNDNSARQAADKMRKARERTE